MIVCMAVDIRESVIETHLRCSVTYSKNTTMTLVQTPMPAPIIIIIIIIIINIFV